MIRKIDGEDILDRIEREGVTFLAGAPAVVAAPRRRRRPHGTQRTDSRPWHRPHGGGRCTAAVEVHRARRDRPRLGVHADLRAHRDVATAHRQPGVAEYDDLAPAERARRLSRAGVPAIGVRIRVDGQGEVQARSNHVFEGYWEQPDATADAIVDGWFHTGDGGELDDGTW